MGVVQQQFSLAGTKQGDRKPAGPGPPEETVKSPDGADNLPAGCEQPDATDLGWLGSVDLSFGGLPSFSAST